MQCTHKKPVHMQLVDEVTPIEAAQSGLMIDECIVFMIECKSLTCIWIFLVKFSSYYEYNTEFVRKSPVS